MNGRFPAGFQWDEVKNRANCDKHGIDFRDAVRAFGQAVLERRDDRRAYGETRFNSLGVADGRVLHITHTGRGGVVRVISARVADRDERRAYLAFLQGLA